MTTYQIEQYQVIYRSGYLDKWKTVLEQYDTPERAADVANELKRQGYIAQTIPMHSIDNAAFYNGTNYAFPYRS